MSRIKEFVAVFRLYSVARNRLYAAKNAWRIVFKQRVD